MSSVGHNPAYIPDQPSCLNIENNVRKVPLVCGGAIDDRVVSTGMEHSIKPLFSTSVPHPRHGSTPEKLLYDIGFTPADCCRILTTSNGVTASAVMIDPTEPDRILGMRCDDDTWTPFEFTAGGDSRLAGRGSSSVTLLRLLIVGTIDLLLWHRLYY